MNLRVPRKIHWQGPFAPVFDFAAGQGFGVEFEATVVVGEDDLATGVQQFQCDQQNVDMIALDIEDAVHALGVGEGRRVDEDQVELVAAMGEPFQGIGLDELMRAAIEAVQHEIAVRPVAVGSGQVDAGGRRGATGCGVDTDAAGIGKQIQEVFAFDPFTH